LAREKRQPRKTHPAIAAAWIGGGCAIVAAMIGAAAIVAAAYISRPTPPSVQDPRYDFAPAESVTMTAEPSPNIVAVWKAKRRTTDRGPRNT